MESNCTFNAIPKMGQFQKSFCGKKQKSHCGKMRKKQNSMEGHFAELTAVFLGAGFLFDRYVSHRQFRQSQRTDVPPILRDAVSRDDLRQAARYSAGKSVRRITLFGVHFRSLLRFRLTFLTLPRQRGFGLESFPRRSPFAFPWPSCSHRRCLHCGIFVKLPIRRICNLCFLPVRFLALIL